MRNPLNLSFRDFSVISGLLLSAVAFTWVTMVKPNNYEWVEAGKTTGIVETVLPDQNLIGGRTIKAVIRLEDGSSAVVKLPMRRYRGLHRDGASDRAPQSPYCHKRSHLPSKSQIPHQFA